MVNLLIKNFAIADVVGAGCLVLGLIYVAIVISFTIIRGRFVNLQGNAMPSISLLVAARNEQNRITPLLRSLEQLDYPSDRLEVILVDDASRDDTPKIIDEYCKKHTNWHLLRVNDRSKWMQGKMAALSKGIAASKGEFIFTTDADCIVQRHWLREMVNCFTPDVSMVLGYSPLLKGRGLLNHFFCFDRMISAIFQAAFAKVGLPIASSGANIAYRREAYESAGGFEMLWGLKSGDDTHLTLLLHRKAAGKIVYCVNPKTFVETQLSETPKEIFFGLIRRNSAVFQRPWPQILVSIIGFASYAAPFSLFFLHSHWVQLGLYILLVRYGLEFVCIAGWTRTFEQKGLIPFLPIFQCAYPFFLMVFNALGATNLYFWKE